MKKISSVVLSCIFLVTVLFEFSSCGVSNKKIMRYQRLEEGVESPTTVEELKEAISKYEERVADIQLAQSQIGIWCNIILTGAGANMEGIVELAQSVFKTSSVRIGIPENLGGIEEKYRTPEFATAIGLVVANKGIIQKRDNRRKVKKNSSKSKGKESVLKRLRKMFF